jgi:thioester reductase-like protein
MKRIMVTGASGLMGGLMSLGLLKSMEISIL